MSQPPRPSLMKAQFIRADLVAMRISAASANANPPPAAAPWISAMIGCGQLPSAALHRMFQVEPGAERCAGALQHHDAGRTVALQAFEVSVQRVDQRRIERVEAVGPVERDPIDAVMMCDQ